MQFPGDGKFSLQMGGDGFPVSDVPMQFPGDGKFSLQMGGDGFPVSFQEEAEVMHHLPMFDPKESDVPMQFPGDPKFSLQMGRAGFPVSFRKEGKVMHRHLPMFDPKESDVPKEPDVRKLGCNSKFEIVESYKIVNKEETTYYLYIVVKDKGVSKDYEAVVEEIMKPRPTTTLLHFIEKKFDGKPMHSTWVYPKGSHVNKLGRWAVDEHNRQTGSNLEFESVEKSYKKVPKEYCYRQSDRGVSKHFQAVAEEMMNPKPTPTFLFTPETMYPNPTPFQPYM